MSDDPFVEVREALGLSDEAAEDADNERRLELDRDAR